MADYSITLPGGAIVEPPRVETPDPSAGAAPPPPSAYGTASGGSALARSMWNWAIHYPTQLGRRLTRDDWTATWGDLGGATYDWGSTLDQQGVNVAADEKTWLGTVDTLSNQYQAGGGVGKFYAPDSGPTNQGTYGRLGADLYEWGRQRQGQGLSKEDWVGAWGNLGAAFYDWARQTYNGFPQDAAAAIQQINSFADVYLPGGGIGTLYQRPDTQQQQYQDWYKDYQDKQAVAQKAYQDAQIAFQQGNTQLGQQQLALAQKAQSEANALAQQQLAQQGQQFNTQQSGYIGGQATVDRQRMEADITATKERIRIAEQQGNAQLALDERKRLDALQIALGQQGISEAGVTGYYGGGPTFARQQFEADLNANPRDWVKQWFYQRGQVPPSGESMIRTPQTGPPVIMTPQGDGTPYSAQAALGHGGVPIDPRQSGQGSLISQGWSQAPVNPVTGAQRDILLAPQYGQPAGVPGSLGQHEPLLYARPGSPGQGGTGSVPIPSWLKSVATNQAMPQFQGTSGGLGDFPLKVPDPNQVGAKTWNRLNPSEQEGLAGLASSSGWYIPDYIAQMQKSFTKQNTSSTPTWGGGF